MLAVLRGPCGVTGLPSTSTRNIANHLSSSWSHTGLTHNPLSFIISTSWTQTSGYHRSKKDLSIILLKDQPLGLKGERVKVRPGFFRNWLYPNKLATYDIRENRLKYPPPSVITRSVGTLLADIISTERSIGGEREAESTEACPEEIGLTGSHSQAAYDARWEGGDDIQQKMQKNTKMILLMLSYIQI